MDMKDGQEQQYYEDASRRQYGAARKIICLVFCLIGLVFLFLGLCFYFEDVTGDDGFPIAYVFAPMGLFWLVLGLILYAFLPRQGNYEHFKTRVERGAILNTNEMALQAAMLQKKTEELEARVTALEKEIKNTREDGRFI